MYSIQYNIQHVLLVTSAKDGDLVPVPQPHWQCGHLRLDTAGAGGRRIAAGYQVLEMG